MSIKRLAVAGIIAAALTLTACTGTGNPTPTGSPTNTPTPTPTVAPITGEAPADEDEAITKAQQTITLLLDVWEQVDATGGNSPELFDIVATGRMLSRVQEDASRTANGPILNEDGESIEGQATVEGRIEFEPTTAYGQEYEGIANGLVIVPGCQDASGRITTTADGKPAMQNPTPRNEVEFHVIYDAETKTWLVNDRIDLGTTC
ncbi:hypothetical protein AB1285_21745 [Microbacterium sp. NRRL B-14842]|jgi:hypothetical protein|uniref:hypothetical protein n=1 Tax=Microbacterium TaxID=33882 RepID=UPI00039B46D3|nr:MULTISPECIES: hypothetical protein [unclassified Microbacterium]KYJ98592.1 hypothetical protein AUV07_01035 [Microbacterium sp. CH1]